MSKNLMQPFQNRGKYWGAPRITTESDMESDRKIVQALMNDVDAGREKLSPLVKHLLEVEKFKLNSEIAILTGGAAWANGGASIPSDEDVVKRIHDFCRYYKRKRLYFYIGWNGITTNVVKQDNFEIRAYQVSRANDDYKYTRGMFRLMSPYIQKNFEYVMVLYDETLISMQNRCAIYSPQTPNRVDIFPI